MRSADSGRPVSDLVGRTPVEVAGTPPNDKIVMRFADGSRATFYHEQDCCEDVYIEDVCGDWFDLLGHPLLVAEERVSSGDITPTGDREHDHATWTFYTFRGVGGSVDVRWLGMSNGFYSERVTLRIDDAKTPAAG